ncbi:MAG: hypothetical protein DDT25_00250 [Chloroflexi bacterium]|nr:hypothetical protein [Chloroflexota bacterium]
MPLSEDELFRRDALRNLGQELLDAIRQVKADSPAIRNRIQKRKEKGAGLPAPYATPRWTSGQRRP